MTQARSRTTTGDEGSQPEAFSGEILKLKIDDLFQEIENLKRRVERLEGQPDQPAGSAPSRARQTQEVVSDPDHPSSGPHG